MWLGLIDFDHFHDDSWPKDWPNPDEKTKHVIIRATKVPNESIIQPISKQPKFINAAAVIQLTQFVLLIFTPRPIGVKLSSLRSCLLLLLFIHEYSFQRLQITEKRKGFMDLHTLASSSYWTLGFTTEEMFTWLCTFFSEFGRREKIHILLCVPK